MKERRIYICEKCGLEIEDDYKAMIDHEHDDHVEPKDFQQPKAIRYLGGNSLYPDQITIEMRNGAIVSYNIRSVVEEPVKKEEPLLPIEALPLEEEPFKSNF